MSLSNLSFSYNELGKINSNGIVTAVFPQIRDAVITEMKNIYGNDIDLSAASADNQYINMEALILNNIYRLIDNLYMQVDPFTATGRYLDILCSLTNVHRKAATASTAKLYVNVSQTPSQQPSYIELHDRFDNIWRWNNTTDLLGNVTTEFSANTPIVLEFTCVTKGEIAAERASTQVTSPSEINWNATNFETINGTIYHVDYAGPDTVYFKVYQNWDAVPGRNEETDQELKSRRYSFIGQNSITTISGLEAALSNYPGIDDVYIINNVTGSSQDADEVIGASTSTTKDNTTIANHDIYIVLRYNDNYPIESTDIAELIYNALTPGVNTTAYIAAGSGEVDSGTDEHEDLNVSAGVVTTVRWKKCLPMNPAVTIKFVTQLGFIGNSGGDYSDLENAMIDAALNYFNNIKLNESILISDLQNVILSADSLYKGQHTFYMTDGYVGANTTQKRFMAPLTYYSYDKENVTLTYTTSSGVTTGTLTFA